MATNPALRAAAEFQADLYIECYAQALRVREAMQDIDAQDDDDNPKDEEPPAGDDLPSVDDEGTVIDAEAEIVFQIASELYAGSREMLLKSIGVAPAAPPVERPAAPTAAPAPESAGRRRLPMGDGRGG